MSWPVRYRSPRGGSLLERDANPVRLPASAEASTANMARRLPTDPGAPLLERGGVMRPEGFSAVMAHRVSARRSADAIARDALAGCLSVDDLDYFPTPPWAARAGGELIREIDPYARTCWEPACGGGHMVHGLRDYFAVVAPTDIHDHGFKDLMAVGDFLGDDPFEGVVAPFDWIVTNPPFVRGEAFVRTAWARAARGVAMLLRLQFLEGAARYRLFQDVPLTCVAPFAERVPMVKGRWDPEASSATAYAWFIWTKAGAAHDVPPRLRFIAPGTRARLSRTEDLTTFVGLADAPLLDSQTPEGAHP